MRAIPGWNGVPFRETSPCSARRSLWAFEHHEFDAQTPEAVRHPGDGGVATLANSLDKLSPHF
jgi:hypothetical protein